jgi:HK97 family phage major capsid protein
MFLNDINARIGELDAELEGIAGLTDPTDDDVARTEAILHERDELRSKAIQAAERTQRVAEAHAKAKAEGRTISGASFEFQKKSDPYDGDVRTMGRDELRDAARAILDRPEARHLPAESKEKAEGLIRKLDTRLAKFAVTTSRPEYRSAFTKYLAGQGHLLSNEERRAVEAVEYESRTDLALADANGGYAVPVLLDPAVIFTGNGSVNPFRQIGRVVTGMDDTWRGVSSAGITAAWVGEATALTEAGPTFAQPTVVSRKGHVYVEYSYEIGDDWSNMASEILTLSAIAKDDLESAAFSTGNGSTAPVGIITALVAGSGTVANVTPTTDGQLGAVDVRGMFTTLPPRYRPNASWVMSLDAMNEVRAFDAGTLGTETVSFRDGYGFPILGRPVYEASGFPDFSGTTGVANIMVVGDFRNYVIFDRVGTRVETIQNVVDGSGVPTGQRGLVMWFRTGADSVNDNAFRLLRNT